MGVSTLTFNGISTVDDNFWKVKNNENQDRKVGIVIQSPPVYEFPTKDIESIHVEGKSGDVIIDKNSFRNVKRTYSIAAIFGEDVSFVSVASKITQWLLSTKGYAKLEDTYEPLYYRMAQFSNPGELRNFYNRVTAMPVSFDCKPQRYLKSGDTDIVLELGQEEGVYLIENQTNQISLPEIYLSAEDLVIEVYNGGENTGPKEITGYTSTTTVAVSGNETLIVDSEYQDCYNGSTLKNDKVSLSNGFPKLTPGKNWIVLRSLVQVTSIKIKPKWWTL